MNNIKPGLILSNEFEPIRQWATEKGLYEKGNPNTQTLKLVEELGELAKAVIVSDKKLIADAIGDCVVVLTNLAHLSGLVMEQCINGAYDEIKDRKGKMEHSTFVKDNDHLNTEH